MKKKVFATLMAAGLIGLSGSQVMAEEITSSRDTIVIANILDVGTIDPTNNVSEAGTRVRQWIFEPLVHLNLSTGEYEALLAESWEYDETGKRLTFHLREGVTFHNGNPFTAEDVLYSWQYYVEKGEMAPDCIKNIQLDECEIVDDYTITMVTENPDTEVLQYLGDVNYGYIFDKETMEAGGDMSAEPIGTGPYQYVDYIVGDSVTLKANENYWGGKPYIENVIFRVISEATQRGIELETGGVDVITNIDQAEFENLQGNEAYTLIEEPGIQVHNLYFNMADDNPLSDINLRKAVAYAINEEALVQGGFGGAAIPAAGVCSPNGIGYLEFEDWYNYDVDKAKEYLAEAGYAEGELTLKLYCDEDANRVGMTEVVMNNLNAIGINVELTTADFASVLATVMDSTHEGWDLFMLKNGKPSAVMQLDTAYNNTTPFVIWDDPVFDELHDKSVQTTDEEEQAGYIKEMQEYFYEQCPYYPMVVQTFNMATTSQLENVESYDLMNPNLPVLYFK